jgi:hypothetical protein
MRIVDRATFLAMPSGTIFAKFGGPDGDPDDAYYGDVCIKGMTCGNDFVVQDLTAQFEGWTGSESNFAEIERMASDPGHESPPLDYDSAGRDGLFDRRQRFAVWSRVDAERLISRLKQAVEEAASLKINA